MKKLRTMFSLADKTEGLRPEDSLSDGSEVLLQRGHGGAEIHSSFCDKDQVVGTSKDYCSLKKTRHLRLRNLALFYVWEDARAWLTEIPWTYTSATWGLYPVLSHPESPQDAPWQGVGGRNILCLLICQGIFFTHTVMAERVSLSPVSKGSVCCLLAWFCKVPG